MIAPDGRVFTESDYEGYGKFGGKDFFDLLCELNGLPEDRGAGIDLVFKNNPNGDNTPGVIYPKFVREYLNNNVVAQYNSLPNPESCEAQGFFYGGDEDEEDDWRDREDEDE
jgi:hypothetical protein